MIQKKMIKGGIGILASILALGGCNSGERIQDPSVSQPQIGATDLTGSSEFDRDLIAAKASGSDPVSREKAILAVFEKYRVAHSPTMGLAESTAPAVTAAAKTAQTNFNPVRRDMSAGNAIHTYRSTVTVANTVRLRVIALGNTAAVDPFLVAYYKDAVQTSHSASRVTVIGVNDDISGMNRNSVIDWINTTGSSKTIEFVAFAYSSSTRGKGTIMVLLDGVSHTNLTNREIGGLSLYGAQPVTFVPNGCSPVGTLVTKKVLSGGGFTSFGLVIDTQVMKGASISAITAPSSQTLELPWIVNNPYPNFALLFKPYTGSLPANWQDPPSQYQLIQQDKYACVN